MYKVKDYNEVSPPRLRLIVESPDAKKKYEDGYREPSPLPEVGETIEGLTGRLYEVLPGGNYLALGAAIVGATHLKVKPRETVFFTKVSYAKSEEPIIAVAPVDMPNCEQAIAIGENVDSNFEGTITIADEASEIMGTDVKQFGFNSSVEIVSAYERLRKTHEAGFEDFLTAATHATIKQQWSKFPMCFPPEPVNRGNGQK